MTGSGNKAAFRHIGFIGLFTPVVVQLKHLQAVEFGLDTCFQHGFIFTEGGNISKSGDKPPPSIGLPRI
jgi:hypothetical protein